MENIKIYNVIDYAKANKKYIDTNYIIYDDIEELCKELNKKKYYHLRIKKDNEYIFFGDIDGYKNTIEEFINLLQDFLKEKYNLYFTIEEFKYTNNKTKEGSYHYSIPKWYLTVEKLKEIHINFLKYKDNKELKSIIDTTIYSEHWFRLPNQLKGNDKNKENMHKIIKGEIIDFILDYIPEYSENISDIEYINEDLEIINVDKNNLLLTNKNSKELVLTKPNNNALVIRDNNSEQVLSSFLLQPSLYKKMFDECYKQERFENYENWISVGMALRNTFNNDDDAFDLFNYYSSKGRNYEGYEKTKFKYATFVKKIDGKGYTIATIYYYAIEDNKPKYVEIMSKNVFELGQQDICKYLKVVAGYKFMYKIDNGIYKLYSYNRKYWENDDVLLRKCIGTELHEFLKDILINVYWNSKDFNLLKKNIDKLKELKMKKEIVETYKEYGVNNEIKFDDKWWLFGFNNYVYDMEKEEIREYKYDDYISITTGYDWREPTEEEIVTITKLIKSIMPNDEERELFLQIICTAIDGRCIEKFVVFHGNGGNGKSLIDDLLLLSLGNYGMIGNNSILFEASKTGSNPEKANIHKKRLVIFREPSEKNKFENSVIKELTGGGSFSARSHHEKTTQKELNLTMIVECNKKPLFTEDPKESELRRIIDLYFRSTFTNDNSKLNDKKYIYEANPMYKTKEFQEKHKYALLKILFTEHKKFKKNGSILKIPDSIKERSEQYLALSCDILQWFKDNYQKGTSEDKLKIKEIYEKFILSDYYTNMSRLEKRKYNKSYFVEYFSTNIFMREYYHERINNIRNIITGWKLKDEEDEE